MQVLLDTLEHVNVTFPFVSALEHNLVYVRFINKFMAKQCELREIKEARRMVRRQTKHRMKVRKTTRRGGWIVFSKTSFLGSEKLFPDSESEVVQSLTESIGLLLVVLSCCIFLQLFIPIYREFERCWELAVTSTCLAWSFDFTPLIFCLIW